MPNSAATAITFLTASLRDMRRVCCKNWIAISRSPVLTSPYNRISHRESTPGAAAGKHSAQTSPSDIPHVKIRR
jgi:hypothetical protein